jgi:hypothetical protein
LHRRAGALSLLVGVTAQPTLSATSDQPGSEAFVRHPVTEMPNYGGAVTPQIQEFDQVGSSQPAWKPPNGPEFEVSITPETLGCNSVNRANVLPG